MRLNKITPPQEVEYELTITQAELTYLIKVLTGYASVQEERRHIMAEDLSNMQQGT